MAHLLHCSIEERWTSFNYERFDAERRGKALCLQTFFRIVGGKHLLGKSAVAFANIMKGRLGASQIGDIREATDTSVYEEALTSLLKDEPSSPALQSMVTTYNRTK